MPLYKKRDHLLQQSPLLSITLELNPPYHWSDFWPEALFAAFAFVALFAFFQFFFAFLVFCFLAFFAFLAGFTVKVVVG